MPTHPFYFLSHCFNYPDMDSFEKSAKVLSLLATDMDIQATVSQLQETALVDQQAEYVRLFINGPGGMAAPPYASVYINNAGILKQQGYDQALAMYCRAGLEPTGGSESADHISHELAFIGLLLEQENEQLLNSFLQDHFFLWYPAFSERLMRSSPRPFYKILAQVTDQCLQQINTEVFA